MAVGLAKESFKTVIKYRSGSESSSLRIISPPSPHPFSASSSFRETKVWCLQCHVITVLLIFDIKSLKIELSILLYADDINPPHFRMTQSLNSGSTVQNFQGVVVIGGGSFYSSCMCHFEQGRGQAYTFPPIPERVLKVSHSASCAGLWSSRAAGGNIQNFMATVPQLCVLLHCVCAALHDSFSLQNLLQRLNRRQNPRLHQSNWPLPLFCVSNCACAPLPVHLSMCVCTC